MVGSAMISLFLVKIGVKPKEILGSNVALQAIKILKVVIKYPIPKQRRIFA